MSDKYHVYLLNDSLLDEALKSGERGDVVLQVSMEDFVCEVKDVGWKSAGAVFKVAGKSDFLAHAKRFGFRCSDDSSKGWIRTFLGGNLHLAYFVNDRLDWVAKNLAAVDWLEEWREYLVNPTFIASGIIDLREDAPEGDKGKKVSGQAKPALLPGESVTDHEAVLDLTDSLLAEAASEEREAFSMGCYVAGEQYGESPLKKALDEARMTPKEFLAACEKKRARIHSDKVDEVLSRFKAGFSPHVRRLADHVIFLEDRVARLEAYLTPVMPNLKVEAESKSEPIEVSVPMPPPGQPNANGDIFNVTSLETLASHRSKKFPKLKEIAVLSNGHLLYVETTPHPAGGKRYYCDEGGLAVLIWDTCLCSEEALLAAIKAEKDSHENKA